MEINLAEVCATYFLKRNQNFKMYSPVYIWLFKHL
jgi:hypothetical protein